MTGILAEELEKIHSASMRLLSSAGVKLHDSTAVELFRAFGVKTNGETVFPTEDFIVSAISSAPSVFNIDARNPKHNICFNGQQSHYAAAYGCPMVTEKSGLKRPSTLFDYLKIAKLVQQSPLFKLNGGILAQPTEVSSALAAASMVYAAILASDKCLFLVPSAEDLFQPILELASVPWGGYGPFSQSPKTLTLISTLSPLQIDCIALQSLRLAAQLGQALIITPGPMAGATGPVTLAGNLALANAECLTAVALSQLVRPGTPVLYGVTATCADLRSGGISIGTPAYAVLTRYSRALADYYHLPSRCGGAVTDADEISSQSGSESMMNLLVSVQNGADLIVHSAGVLSSWASFSFEKFIIDLDLIAMAEYYLKPLLIDDETLALETIEAAGPGGLFLNKKHTLKHARTTPFYPKVACSGPSRGLPLAQRLLDNAQIEQDRLLSSYEPINLPADQLEQMQHILVKQGAKPEFLDSIGRQLA
jgi:trimethylamine--corrinoid protein Co-methyltransferase